MVVSIVILVVLFAVTLLVDLGGDPIMRDISHTRGVFDARSESQALSDYCRTECWSWKIRKLNQCC